MAAAAAAVAPRAPPRALGSAAAFAGLGLWLLLPLATAQPRTLPPDPADGVTQEMMDMEEHNRKQGFAAGVTGEYFRYKHMFWKQPSEKDREEAMQVAGKIRCDVCAAIVESLLVKANSLSEDGIAEVLEGHLDYEKTGDHVHDQMMQHKKGCNKHFKDELIAQGYVLRSCKDVDPSRGGTEPCIWQNASSKPNQMAVDSYEMWKECFFYACEQTVSRFSDSLAEYLAEALPGASDRGAVVRAACEQQARCRGRPAAAAGGAGGAGDTRQKSPSPPSAPPKRRRRRRHGGGGEL